MQSKTRELTQWTLKLTWFYLIKSYKMPENNPFRRTYNINLDIVEQTIYAMYK